MENMELGNNYSSYVEALELERVKMLVFQRELPLSIELVSRAIENYRQQQHLSESLPEGTTSNDRGAVLEFISIKNPIDTIASSPESEGHLQDLNQQPCASEKSDWLRSVQLWNQTPDQNEPSKKESDAAKEGSKPKDNTTVEKSTESSSTDIEELEESGGSKRDVCKEESAKRKPRRCWSQELHRRFLNSLEQLGGAHVATPKQIRELMKVDGLTNDEVKSHLQKYRLHTRRPTPPPNQSSGCNAEAPQFVVVGGIWVPSSDHYPTMPLANRDANTTYESPSRNGVYAPMAAPLVQPHSCEQFNSKRKINMNKNSEGHGDALARCISSSMSSSTRTTASPVY